MGVRPQTAQVSHMLYDKLATVCTSKCGWMTPSQPSRHTAKLMHGTIQQAEMLGTFFHTGYARPLQPNTFADANVC